ncbi:MAG TPA: hypothetical protein P5555_13330 [Candidatus Paceibacterota bacterium]|nr:hypothetical protein [Verrucomicrobiota bacterium]HRZ46166.1 hypothetical protein [Candidatus Paceibacterota bacterium]
MKRIRKWHRQWLLIAAVLGLSVGGSGQWADRRQQSFPPAIALPNGPSPGGSVALGSMGWAGNGRANDEAPEAGLWPEAGADGQYRVIDASRYDRQLQREHELVLCQGHRVLWRFGEQLREEALDSIRWSAAGGVVGRAVGTAVKTARQAVRHGHSATKAIPTPHGPAVQAMTAEAQAALRQVQGGATVYRQGWTGTQRTFDAQYWALQNPATAPDFARQLGMPATATEGEFFWMMGGRVAHDAPVITRPAPGIGANRGGSMEAVVNSGGVTIDWFHMPD